MIEDNEFETFDAPILYAKSVDGLVFRNNTIKLNTEYKPFHPNRNRFLAGKGDECDDCRINIFPLFAEM